MHAHAKVALTRSRHGTYYCPAHRGVTSRLALIQRTTAVRRVVKITSLLAAVVLVAVGALLFTIYKASQSVPEFYRTAIAVEPEEQADSRDAFVAQATALASDLNQDGHWQSLFTAEQINAWLALELAASYPDLLPAELHDPRVTLDKNEATIGCRYQHGDLVAVLSLTFDAYLHEPNVVALRIRRARAGALPVPLAEVLDNISYAARQLNLRLEWVKSQGDPVALITLPQPRDGGRGLLSLETLELRDGELFVSGTVGKTRLDASPIVPEPLRVPTAARDAQKADQPLLGAADKETRQK
jgi:hypothetical protein